MGQLVLYDLALQALFRHSGVYRLQEHYLCHIIGCLVIFGFRFILTLSGWVFSDLVCWV